MSEIRTVSTTYGPGGYDSTKPNNNIVEEITRVVSDVELAVEAEIEALTRADQIINSINNLDGMKGFLKKLCARLIENGSLP